MPWGVWESVDSVWEDLYGCAPSPTSSSTRPFSRLCPVAAFEQVSFRQIVWLAANDVTVLSNGLEGGEIWRTGSRAGISVCAACVVCDTGRECGVPPLMRRHKLVMVAQELFQPEGLELAYFPPLNPGDTGYHRGLKATEI